jgi:hypothetical protein
MSRDMKKGFSGRRVAHADAYEARLPRPEIAPLTRTASRRKTAPPIQHDSPFVHHSAPAWQNGFDCRARRNGTLDIRDDSDVARGINKVSGK